LCLCFFIYVCLFLLICVCFYVYACLCLFIFLLAGVGEIGPEPGEVPGEKISFVRAK